MGLKAIGDKGWEQGTFFVNELARRHKEDTPLVVVDVGAFVGWVSEAIRAKFQQSTIYALEPEPKNYQVCLDRFKGDTNVFMIGAALDKMPGKTALFYAANPRFGDLGASSQGNSFYANFAFRKQWAKRTAAQLSVATISMPLLIEQYELEQIDLLKLNIEGGEYRIFEVGANLEWLKCVKLLAVIWHVGTVEFDSGAFILARIEAMRRFEEYGFELVRGQNVTRSARHIKQLWSRM